MGVPRTLAKGLSKLKEAAELRKLGGTQAERMARAAEQGYDTSRVFYHGTGADVTEFDPLKMGKTDDGWFSKGFYFSPDAKVANQYAADGTPNVLPVYLRAQNPYDWRQEVGQGMRFGTMEERYAKTREIMDKGYDSVDVYDEIVQLGEGEKLSDDVWQAIVARSLEMGNPVLPRDLVENGLRQGMTSKGEFARYYGDELANKMPLTRTLRERVVFDPSQVRSVNAEFNPANRDSPNLLAGIAGAMPYAGATAAALAGATGSQEAEAGPLQTLGRAAPYLTSAALGGAAALQSNDAEAGIITRGGRRLIEAWHGSPHIFDKFDIGKIGIGEGMQVRGNGLYFADEKAVANEYRQTLRDMGYTYDGQRIDRVNDGIRSTAADLLYKANGDKAAAKKAAENYAYDNLLIPEIDKLDPDKISLGSLYRVEIDVDPDTMLDYEKPLNEQTQKARELLERAGINTESSATAGSMIGGQEQFLAQAGIPGIRYLDGMSRNAGEGSYNYVLFDDAPINIVERGNATPALLAATAVGTGAGMYAASPEQAQAYNDYIRDEMEARTAADKFAQMRGSKAGYWEARRQELLDMVNGLGALAQESPLLASAGNPLIRYGIDKVRAVTDPYVNDAIDRPLRAVLAGAGALANVATGENLATVGQNAQQVWNRDSLETTGNLGDQAADWIMRQGESASPNPLQEGAAELARFGLKWIPQVASPI